MREFFKGWKRTLGLLTLLFACVFAAGWVRSRRTVDQVVFPIPSILSSQINVGVLCLWRQGVVLILQANGRDARASVAPKWWSWESSHISATAMTEGLDGLHEMPNMQVKFRCFGVSHSELINPSYPSDSMRTWYYMAPYAPIVIPLTLISAWLLLSKPRVPVIPATGTAR